MGVCPISVILRSRAENNLRAQEPDSIVGCALFTILSQHLIDKHVRSDIEGEMIAFCTKPVHGTRVMPPGTITGVQFIRTPDYVQVTGRMEQTNLNIQEGDYGGAFASVCSCTSSAEERAGEMDSAGADQRGNVRGAYTTMTAS